MKLNGEFTFDAPQEEVWETLQDPEVLAKVLPGCEKLELVGENAYEGALKIKVGPVQGLFKGKINLSDIQPPDSYSMDVDGRGAPGFVKAKAQVSLSSSGQGTTMTYTSDARVGGRIASVGQRLLDSSAKAIVKQSLEGLNTIMQARTAAADESADETPEAAPSDDANNENSAGADDSPDIPSAEAAPAVKAAPAKPKADIDYQAPSQAEFAANVAKEVAKDLIPKPVLIGGVIVIVAAIIYLML